MIKAFKKTQTFEQGAMLLLISGLLVKLIGAFFKIPLSSDYCLGDIGFGYFSSVYDFYIPIYTLTSSGIPSAVSRIISEYLVDGNYSKSFSAFKIFKKLMLIVGLIGTVGLLLISFPLVNLTDKTGKTLMAFLAMCPAVLFCGLSSVYRGFYEGNRNMIPTAVSNIIDALSKVLLGFTSAYITVKLTGNVSLSAASAMAGITVGTVISYLFLKLYYNGYRKPIRNYSDDYYEDKKLYIKLIKISLPIVLSSLAISLVSFIDSLTVRGILTGVVSKNYDSVFKMIGCMTTAQISADTLPTFLYGIKSKAYTLFNLIPVLTGFIASSAIPSITREFVSDNKEKLNTTINSSIKLSAFLCFPMGFGLTFINQHIMSLLYGDGSALIGGKMLLIYGISALFAGLITVLTAILQSAGKQNAALLNFLIGLILKIIGNILFVAFPKINIFGSALSTALFFSFVCIAHFYVLMKNIRILPDFKSVIIKPLISAFLCGISAFLICKISDSGIITVISIAVAVVVYFVSSAIFKTFTIAEIGGFLKKNT